MTLQPIDYYGRDGLGADENRDLLQREQRAIELVRRYAPERAGASVLDVGCGNGFFLQQLDERLRRDYRYHGVDYSPYQVECAASRPYEVRLGNLEEGIPHDAATFDVVYAGEVIEHLYNPDHLIAECRRVLRPDGLLVLSTPNLHAWFNRVLFPLGIQPLFYEVSTRSALVGAGPLRRLKRQQMPVGHLRLFHRRALHDLLTGEGFTPLAVAGATFHALPMPLRPVDSLFARIPSWAANLLVAARRLP